MCGSTVDIQSPTAEIMTKTKISNLAKKITYAGCVFTPTLNAAEAVGVAARQRRRLVKNDETDAADQGLVQALEEINRLLHATS